MNVSCYHALTQTQPVSPLQRQHAKAHLYAALKDNLFKKLGFSFAQDTFSMSEMNSDKSNQEDSMFQAFRP